MRRLEILVLMAGMGTVGSAMGQCQPALIGFDQASILDVFVSGTTAYTRGEFGNLYIIDVSDPTAPTRLGMYGCSPDDVYVLGTIAYVTGSHLLQLVDVADPTVPTLLGTYDTTNEGGSVVAVGTTAFVVSGGLHILDVSDPATPILLGFYRTPGIYENLVSVSGSTAYVGGFYYADGIPMLTLALLDVSDPADPVLLGTYETPGDSCNNLYVSDTAAYMAMSDYSGSGAVQIIDVTTPEAPMFLGSYTTSDFALGIAVSGSTAYVATYHSGLTVIDVADPAEPTLLGAYDTPGYARQVRVSGTTAYVADDRDGGAGLGLAIVDVTSCTDSIFPCEPMELGQIDTDGECRQIAASEFVVAVHEGGPQVQFVDVTDPSHPALAGTHFALNSVQDLECVGSRIYMSNLFAVQVVDVTDPYEPLFLGEHETLSYARGLDVAGTLLCVADSSQGIQLVDMADPSLPDLLSILDTSYAHDVVLQEDLVFVADGEAGLLVVDVADPMSPSVIGQLALGGTTSRVVVGGSMAAVYNGEWNLIDLSDPHNPVLVDAIRSWSGYDVESVALAGDLLFLGTTQYIEVFDISVPFAPSILATRRIGFPVSGVDVVHSTLYLAAGVGGGMRVLDASECLPCLGDWNGDGQVDTIDFVAFLNDWASQFWQDCSAGDCSADLNRDGVVNTIDFIAFLNGWATGC